MCPSGGRAAKRRGLACRSAHEKRETAQAVWLVVFLRSSKGCSKVGPAALQVARFCTETRESNGWSTRVAPEMKTLSLGRAAKSAAEQKALHFGS